MFSCSERNERAHRFADGELAPSDAAGFQRHLIDCLDCQEELETVMLLRARTLDLPPRMVALAAAPPPSEGGGAVPRRPAWRRLVRRGVPYGLTAVVLAVVVVTGVALRTPPPDRSPEVVAQAFDVLARGGQRPLLERLTYGPADRYRRPTAVMRNGRNAAAAPIAALEVLRQRQDGQGALAVWLWAGDVQEAQAAGSAVAALPVSMALDNDLAVLDMRRSRLDEALARLDRVLAQDPNHPQALWNRALVFERRNQPGAALRDYQAVAARGEAGWSEEARQRARALQGHADVLPREP